LKTTLRVILAGLFCASAAAASVVAVLWITDRDQRAASRRELAHARRGDANVEASTDKNRGSIDKGAGSAALEINPDRFEDGGFGMAVHFTGPIHDPTSLGELREAVRGRAARGIAEFQSQIAGLDLGAQSPIARVALAGQLYQCLGLILMYNGQFAEAAQSFERAIAIGGPAGIPPQKRAELTALAGIACLRRGEIDNCIGCLGPSSCIFPIVPEAVHTQQTGSREALKWFNAYLDDQPGDLRVRWLLNIAHMTLGEYPSKVASEYLIPLDSFRSNVDLGRFANVAPLVGLVARGPNEAGGSIFDDFTGDGLPDIFSTSLGCRMSALLFVNKGDGTFEDRSKPAGLDDQIYALNASHSDFDNDGDLDILMMRGAWEGPLRMTLLRNRGDGTFEDVTMAAGLGTPIASLAAAWGDYDNDGLLDIFVGGEYLSPVAAGFARGESAPTDPRNLSRLYHNQGNGTFADMAASAGVTNERCTKGAAWGDYDGDGRLDLFVSNMGQDCRLYHNDGNGKFRDVAPELGTTGDQAGFACWFWDFDNDGKLDIYVNDNRTTLAVTAATALGVHVDQASRPRLYRNLGGDGFRDVTRDVGLDRPMAPMGCNFGDVDNDGYLDIYLGTGWLSTSSLVPNLMFKNVDGRRFEDVTLSSGTGHLQKGHGVSFADWDGDGALDIFVETGGASPGDAAHNLLFQNPGHGRHWLKVKLVGTKTNRAGFGARIKATVQQLDGSVRWIYRTVGNNSSFGGNSLVQSIGLGDSAEVSELEVSWPTSATTQTFQHLAADQTIVITEGSKPYKAFHQRRLAVPANVAAAAR
jgi:hypothetical protein